MEIFAQLQFLNLFFLSIAAITTAYILFLVLFSRQETIDGVKPKLLILDDPLVVGHFSWTTPRRTVNEDWINYKFCRTCGTKYREEINLCMQCGAVVYGAYGKFVKF